MFESGNFFYGGFALVDVAEELCISETNVFFVGRCGYALHILYYFALLTTTPN